MKRLLGFCLLAALVLLFIAPAHALVSTTTGVTCSNLNPQINAVLTCTATITASVFTLPITGTIVWTASAGVIVTPSTVVGASNPATSQTTFTAPSTPGAINICGTYSGDLVYSTSGPTCVMLNAVNPPVTPPPKASQTASAITGILFIVLIISIGIAAFEEPDALLKNIKLATVAVIAIGIIFVIFLAVGL